MNGYGALVLAGLFALIMYGITVPMFRPRIPGEQYTLGWWIAATVTALAITAAIWCLIMYQTGVWKP